jgi:glycosyltransferase involved in cell wall biosynthesis
VLRRFAAHADITLVVGGYPSFEPATRDGIRLRAAGFGKSHALSRLTYTFFANLWLVFDRSHIVGLSPSPHSPLLAWRLRRKRTYLVLHHYVGKRILRKLGARGVFQLAAEQLFLRLGCHYIVLNRDVRDRLRRVNPTARVELSANGVDPALAQLEAGRSTAPFILFVGRFDAYMKGLDVLIRAYRDATAGKDITLVLAGRASSSSMRDIRQLIPHDLRDRIRLEPNIDDERKRELLATCLFFCSPSRFEGFGIAALEANAAGKAVVATDVEGFRESLAFGETALAVIPDDVAALRDAMRRLIDDETLRNTLGRNGRARAASFSWDAVAEREWAWIRTWVPR